MGSAAVRMLVAALLATLLVAAPARADTQAALYIGITSAGSGAAGQLLGFAVNQRQSLGFVDLAPMDAGSPEAQGYMGRDRFAVERDQLVRRFPLYLPGDANAAPRGGSRALFYRLVPGEAGWQLVLDRRDDQAPMSAPAPQKP